MEKFTALYGGKEELGEDLIGLYKVSIWAESFVNARLSAEDTRPKDMYLVSLSCVEAGIAINNVMLRKSPVVEVGMGKIEQKVIDQYLEGNDLKEAQEALITDLHDVFGTCAYEPSERGAGIAFNDDVYPDVKCLLESHGVIFIREFPC